MSDKKPNTIDWAGEYGIYLTGDEELAAVDWVPVADYNGGSGYDWIEFHAFWSPSARRFFWYGDSGCSCNYWGDGLYRPSDFHDGDKAVLQRAFREFAEVYHLNSEKALRAADEIARFKTRSF